MSNVLMAPPGANRQADIIIGLDIGATFSGVAFQVSVGNDLLFRHHITGWPIGSMGTELRHQGKVPSVIRFTGPSDNDVEWGFPAAGTSNELPPGSIELFKFLLVPPADTPVELRESLIFREAEVEAWRCGRGSPKIVGHFIKSLLQHSVAQIEQHSRGRRWDPAHATYHFMVTVPPDWSAVAQQSMRQALQFGGITDSNFPGHTITLLNEASAAARACLDEFGVQNMVRVGDAIVVVDAGGATVDMVSYRVNEVGPRLAVEQCSLPSSVLAGGLFYLVALERVVQKTIRHRFGVHVLLRASDVQTIRKSIEFRLDAEQIKVPLPPRFRLENGISTTSVQVPRSEVVEEIYRLSFDRIVNAIAAQIQQASLAHAVGTVRLVIMVGGYSNNSQLIRRVKEVIEGPLMTVLDPQSADVAATTVKGACLQGYEDFLRERGFTLPGNVVIQPHFKASFGLAVDSVTADDAHRAITWVAIKGARYDAGVLPQRHAIYADITASRLVLVLDIWKSASARPGDTTSPDASRVDRLTVPIDGANEADVATSGGRVIYRVEVTATILSGNAVAIHVYHFGTDQPMGWCYSLQND